MVKRTRPPITGRVINVLRHTYKVASKYIKEGVVVAPPKVRAERIAICQSCPRYVDGMCSVCGCNLDRTAARYDLLRKTTYAVSTCPEGRWEN